MRPRRDGCWHCLREGQAAADRLCDCGHPARPYLHQRELAREQAARRHPADRPPRRLPIVRSQGRRPRQQLHGDADRAAGPRLSGEHDPLDRRRRGRWAPTWSRSTVAPTQATGRCAVFHDWTVDCRTEGKGEIRDKTMAELKQLDPGYGYTADGGKTFPLPGAARRARSPAFRRRWRRFRSTPLIFNFKSTDPAEADQLAARACRLRGATSLQRRDVFYGHSGPIERITPDLSRRPGRGAIKQSAKTCSQGLCARRAGPASCPESCRNGTHHRPDSTINGLYWGWPNRPIQRMDGKVGAAGARSSAPTARTGRWALTLPEQLGDIRCHRSRAMSGSTTSGPSAPRFARPRHPHRGAAGCGRGRVEAAARSQDISRRFAFLNSPARAARNGRRP